MRWRRRTRRTRRERTARAVVVPVPGLPEDPESLEGEIIPGFRMKDLAALALGAFVLSAVSSLLRPRRRRVVYRWRNPPPLKN